MGAASGWDHSRGKLSQCLGRELERKELPEPRDNQRCLGSSFRVELNTEGAARLELSGGDTNIAGMQREDDISGNSKWQERAYLLLGETGDQNLRLTG